MTIKQSKSYRPSGVGDLTHRKPNSFPIQRLYPLPHHVSRISCSDKAYIRKLKINFQIR